MNPPAPPAPGTGAAADDLPALLFDGRSARGLPVRLCLRQGQLQAWPQDAAPGGPPLRRWPQAELQWPERTRHGRRVLHLADGASLQVDDSAAFDAWRARQGPREGWVVRAQQNWRATLLALLLLLAALAGAWRWGVPATARGVVAVLPATADATVGAQALQAVQARWLQPTALSPARQQALRAAFAQMVAQGWPEGGAPAYTLHFHAATDTLGANAFALPGGDIVVTDALVALLDGHDDTLLGVMAHELGHVQHRHGMQALVQFTLLGAASSLVLGDFSSLLAVLPAWLAQQGYSRDAEREADAVAARLLLASGRSPAAMVVLFERLWPQRAEAEGGGGGEGGEGLLAIALASHPADAERVRFFQDAAAGRH